MRLRKGGLSPCRRTALAPTYSPLGTALLEKQRLRVDKGHNPMGPKRGAYESPAGHGSRGSAASEKKSHFFTGAAAQGGLDLGIGAQ